MQKPFLPSLPSLLSQLLRLLPLLLCSCWAHPAPAQESALHSSVQVERASGAMGGGTLVAPGLVLTALHVVGTQKIVKLTPEEGDPVLGLVVKTSSAEDLALVRFEPEEMPDLVVAAVRCTDPLNEPVLVALGHPFHWPFVALPTGALEGHVPVAGPGGVPSELALLQGPALPGMSGGGIFTPGGVLIAVTDASIGLEVGGALGVIPLSSACAVFPEVQAAAESAGAAP